MNVSRRLAASLLALVLAVSIAPARAARYGASGLYTIRYDEAEWTLDDQTYLGDSTADYTWLFLLYSDDCDIDADLRRLEGYEGFSLYAATEAERALYLADTLDALADQDGALVTALDAGDAAIPFYVYKCRDEDGEYYLAETLAQGYAVGFYACYTDASAPVDEALLQRLLDILATFEPTGMAVDKKAEHSSFFI